ncbi:MAG TPA: flagellar hook protein FlgE [Pedomonas sp.]|uniref:flagellar hook protein FlgE n=1 Tax=Pedomonas sp. TaxID=2976421 RepID=UPI002F40B5BC
MSLYAALYSGTSGLAANSSALGIISDNITNVNTVGYKAANAEFMTLVTESSTYGTYSPGGVQARARSLIGAQGLLQTSTSATDLAIDGNGFFVVKPEMGGKDVAFTRAGSFRADDRGFLQNTAGMYLMGWPLDANGAYVDNGDVNVLSPINIAALTGTAEATTTAKVRANLMSSQEPYAATPAYAVGSMADGTIEPHFSKTIKVYDSQGSAHNITMSFLKNANTNEWNVEIHGPASDIAGGTPQGLVASGTVLFNEDGSLNLAGSTAALFEPVAFDWTNGAADSNITFNFGTDGMADGLTQFDSASTMISSSMDGAVFGNVTGVSVGKDGVVTALFDNGLTRAVYKLPIATFQNPEGLMSVAGNAFAMTDYSGAFELVSSGTGGAGSVAPSTLEASTVDLAEEFTKLITTQRAYSASARIITTADEMLTELNQLKR